MKRVWSGTLMMVGVVCVAAGVVGVAECVIVGVVGTWCGCDCGWSWCGSGGGCASGHGNWRRCGEGTGTGRSGCLLPAATNGGKRHRFEFLFISQSEAVLHGFIQQLLTFIWAPAGTVTVDHKLRWKAITWGHRRCEGVESSTNQIQIQWSKKHHRQVGGACQ